MCGITGFIDISRQAKNDELYARVTRMADTLRHRGPDDNGVWVEAETGIALGHRRLSIIDLSPEGHQPMSSACSRYVITYNGEIYNYQQIRKELEASGMHTAWRGHSDTEVMLEAIRQWGLEAAIKRFNGMFAFALWDRKERTLYLVRDRFGEKPLYYGWMTKTFLFGSELKALRAHPDFKGEIDRDALALYLRHNYIPAPYSIYRNIYKLAPGTILTLNTLKKETAPEITPYWLMRDVAEYGVNNPFQSSDEEAMLQLDILLREAVKMRMEADVPLGAFLSGGIDSSLIVSLMQAQNSKPVKTFSIGFHEETHNEAPYAKAVAKHLGTEHTELYITTGEAMAVIPRLPAVYDEPFSDSSQIPTLLVAGLARKFVTVSLSGDGGDEIFGGYNRYHIVRNVLKRMRWIPKGFRKSTASIITLLSPSAWESIFKKLYPVVPERFKLLNPGEKIYKLAQILFMEHPEEIYVSLISHFKDPTSIVLNSHEPPTALTDQAQWTKIPDFTQRMMYFDTITYLPGDILAKVDRASMSVSLESRIPMLDHRLAEFVWQIPLSMKIRGSSTKWLSRQLLYNYVPRKLIERPKMGFAIPFGGWLRTGMRDWTENLLDEKRLQRDGFFDSRPIRKMWLEHLSGKYNWQYHLWDILMFQAWLDENNTL
ncbi:MAG: asparagine synthase (glutamine-hydrolyzing) [Deltaproteobacteria bacterium]|nr:asparagine synthase (glutamine-hydrolyzing) [Deltaproteobacteria bacterium]